MPGEVVMLVDNTPFIVAFIGFASAIVGGVVVSVANYFVSKRLDEQRRVAQKEDEWEKRSLVLNELLGEANSDKPFWEAMEGKDKITIAQMQSFAIGWLKANQSKKGE